MFVFFLFVVYALFVVSRWLRVGSCSLLVVRCLFVDVMFVWNGLFDGRSLLFVVRCLLALVMCCLWFVARCCVFVFLVCCSLLVL